MDSDNSDWFDKAYPVRRAEEHSWFAWYPVRCSSTARILWLRRCTRQRVARWFGRGWWSWWEYSDV